jgi:hypothetical protein
MSNRSDPRYAIAPILLAMMLLLAQSLVAQTGFRTSEDSLQQESERLPGYADSAMPDRPAGSDTIYLEDSEDAGGEFVFDSSAMVARLPSNESIEQLRADRELRYDVEGHTPETFWDRLMHWVGELFGWAVMTPGALDALEWIVYIILGAVVVMAIWKLITGDRSGLLAKDGGPRASITATIEDIHAVDFDPLIEAAIRERDFRGATRLLYLKGLRRLSERNLIEWRRDRMNHDYLRQLGQTELADPFARCTLLFEYVWYGDFPIDEATFGGVSGTLRNFISRVEGSR